MERHSCIITCICIRVSSGRFQQSTLKRRKDCEFLLKCAIVSFAISKMRVNSRKNFQKLKLFLLSHSRHLFFNKIITKRFFTLCQICKYYLFIYYIYYSHITTIVPILAVAEIKIQKILLEIFLYIYLYFLLDSTLPFYWIHIPSGHRTSCAF